MKRFFLGLLLFLSAGAAEAKLMDVAHFKLDNGLDVLVIENRKAPVAVQMLYYKTGSMYDPKGKGGIAHLLEHLMFRGTKRVKDKEFNNLTHEFGAENNAYTTFDETAYYEFSDISKLELMMALEADRMTGLDISDEAFEAERNIVFEERMQRYESVPSALFYETMRKLLWQDSPLANPVSGSPAEIKGLKKEDAEAFYRKWYRPDNALLVLVGDLEANEAKKLAVKYYGGLKNPKLAAEDKEKAEDVAVKGAVSRVTMALDGVEQPRYMAAIRLEKEAFSKKDILALSLFSEYLAGDDTSFLFDKLVYDKKALLSVDTGVSYAEDLGGSFGFYAVPAKEGIGEREISLLLEQEVAEALAAFDKEQLEKIKNEMLVDVVYLQENPEVSARFAGNMFMAGYEANEIVNYDEMIGAITLEDVHSAWEKVRAGKVQVAGFLEAKK